MVQYVTRVYSELTELVERVERVELVLESDLLLCET